RWRGIVTTSKTNLAIKVLRCATYARYSTDMQNPKSAEDQTHDCMRFAERQNNWRIVKSYYDRECSSMTLDGRSGWLALEAAIQRGEYDVVIVECTDRIGRDAELLYGVESRTRHFNCQLWSVSEGVLDRIKIGLRGIVGEIHMGDLSNKVRRGQSAIVRGGRTNAIWYGVRPVLGKPGEREIDPEAAKVVKRAFRMFADGNSPQKIADTFNGEGIQPPRGEAWSQASFTSGPTSRKHGILANRAYLGELHYGETSGVRNPITKRKGRKLNDKAEATFKEVPHLRIIDQELFDRVQAMLSSRAVKRGKVVSRYNGLLSGLIKCAVCGGDMRIGAGYDPRLGPEARRVHCANAARRLGCNHKRSYYLRHIERETVQHVAKVFANPDMVNQMAEEFEKRTEANQRAANNEL